MEYVYFAHHSMDQILTDETKTVFIPSFACLLFP